MPTIPKEETTIEPVYPCYIYEETQIKEACHRLRRALPGMGLLYSVKANPFPSVVRLMAAQNFGADAASLPEAELALACGMAREDIYYSSPGKREADIAGALGKCVLIADSLHELQLIQRIAAERDMTARIGLRIHPGFSFAGASSGASKFGVDIEQIQDLKTALLQCPNIQPAGVHIHLRSQVLDAAMIGAYYRNVLRTAQEVSEYCSFPLEFVNFGSGIGTVYDDTNDTPVDMELLREAAAEIAAADEAPHIRLLVETGRYVTCRAGRYVTPVVDRKASHGVTYLVVPGAMNGFLRPAIASLLEKAAGGTPIPGMEPLYTGRNEFQIRVLNDAAERETVTVVGNLCTALDVIKENVTLPKAEIGDLLEITNAGSYGYSLSPLLFSGHDAPKRYLHTSDGKWIYE